MAMKTKPEIISISLNQARIKRMDKKSKKNGNSKKKPRNFVFLGNVFNSDVISIRIKVANNLATFFPKLSKYFQPTPKLNYFDKMEPNCIFKWSYYQKFILKAKLKRNGTKWSRFDLDALRLFFFFTLLFIFSSEDRSKNTKQGNR